jgi:hypothetical protein
MISIKAIREIYKNSALSDEQLERIRELCYTLAELEIKDCKE